MRHGIREKIAAAMLIMRALRSIGRDPWRAARRVVDTVFEKIPIYDVRVEEYRKAVEYLSGCRNVLDIGCGTGTFLRAWKGRAVGIDANPENVAHGRALGLNLQEGDALALPFAPDSFDGVHCSHLLQVFQPADAVRLLREAFRVVCDQGVVVITTLNWFSRFYRHPENARPYPPDAVLRLGHQQFGATSPMFPGIVPFKQEAIWLRRPPLLELFSVRPSLDDYLWRLNLLQLRCGLRKYWTYDAYTVKLRVTKPPVAA